MKKLRQWTFVYGLLGVVIVVASLTVACKSENVVVDGYIEEESSIYETLGASTAEMFSYDDLIVNKLKLGMTEEEVKALLGEPANYYDSKEILSSTTQATQNAGQNQTQVETQKVTQAQTQLQTGANADEVLDEKVYAYNDLSLIFMPIDGTYKLCAAASLGDDDVFSRGIKVGDSKDKILDLYYRDRNCLNNNVMTEDKATIIGKYLYGTFTLDDLGTVKTADKIQSGIINYNGYASMEVAKSYIIELTYFEPPYKEQNATYNDDFAQIAFDIDEKGIITGIRWYYYPENNDEKWN